MSQQRIVVLFLFLIAASLPAYAGSGTEGAAFLDIPVGAGPAALGSAYSALAQDAYAPTHNPAGLGFLQTTQLSGQHLAYLDSNHYEFLSFVHPFKTGHALGVSAQYLGTGDIAGSDLQGNPTGSFSSHYAAYNVAYGQTFGEKLSLGLTGKWINAQIDDVQANAYAVDLGSMYKLEHNLTLAATVTNLGSKLTFLNEGDPLPLAYHLGAAFQPTLHWSFSAEGIYRQTGLTSGHLGMEWRPIEMIALRTGYRTDTVKGLSALAGFTTGLGFHLWGQELDYAWVPLGDLGNTHYISFVVRFGQEDNQNTLIQYQHIKTHRTVSHTGGSSAAEDKEESKEPDYQNMMELLNTSETHVATQNPKSVPGHE